jgi:hypothetical protein
MAVSKKSITKTAAQKSTTASTPKASKAPTASPKMVTALRMAKQTGLNMAKKAPGLTTAKQPGLTMAKRATGLQTTRKVVF